MLLVYLKWTYLIVECNLVGKICQWLKEKDIKDDKQRAVKAIEDKATVKESQEDSWIE